jgi:DNA-binding MarR family transcriptional regulator
MLPPKKPRRPSSNRSTQAQPTQSILLEDQLCFALYAASLAMTKFYKPMLAPLALTYPQYLVMLVLWEQDEQTVGALCDRLFLDSGTLTPLLKRMELQGLVGRERDPEDERRVIIRLTSDGKALKVPALELPRKIPAAIEPTCGDLDELIGALTTLRGKLARQPLQA